MTAKTMAEVLAELDAHKPDHNMYTGGWWELACTGCDFAKGRRLSHLDHTPHHAHRAEVFAAALSAAGFGLVADAKAEALEEAAKDLDWVKPETACEDAEACCGSAASCDRMRPSSYAVGADWLRNRAKAVRES